jgi:hypothetical protein
VLPRVVILAALALLLLTAATPAQAGTALVRSAQAGTVDLQGVGCAAATDTATLPQSARDIRVNRPKVGDTTIESRITAVTITGSQVQFTGVGEGDDVCDPELPPEQQTWQAMYPYDIEFKERVVVAQWPGADLPKAKPKTRPRRLTVPDIATMVRIRWRLFGGRRAVGHGHLKCEIPGCVGRGDRFKIVLDRPSRCSDLGYRVYYGRVRFYTTRRYGNLTYPIRRGALYSGGTPHCRTSAITRA